MNQTVFPDCACTRGKGEGGGKEKRSGQTRRVFEIQAGICPDHKINFNVTWNVITDVIRPHGWQNSRV